MGRWKERLKAAWADLAQLPPRKVTPKQGMRLNDWGSHLAEVKASLPTLWTAKRTGSTFRMAASSLATRILPGP